MTHGAVISALIGAASIALTLYQHGCAVSSDGSVYLDLAKRQRSPFCLRWLLPLILPKRLASWAAISWLSLVGSAAAMWWWACIMDSQSPVAVAAMWTTLPIYRVAAHFPVLVDAPGLALGLAAACMAQTGQVRRGVVTTIFANTINEKTAIFAALWAKSPMLAFGLIPTVIAAIVCRLRHGRQRLSVVSRARQRNATRLNSAAALLAPWGLGLAAVFASWTPIELATLAVAYAQLFVACDCTRLYQWAAPVVLPKAVAVLPSHWHVPAIVAMWFNPWGGLKL